MKILLFTFLMTGLSFAQDLSVCLSDHLDTTERQIYALEADIKESITKADELSASCKNKGPLAQSLDRLAAGLIDVAAYKQRDPGQAVSDLGELNSLRQRIQTLSEILEQLKQLKARMDKLYVLSLSQEISLEQRLELRKDEASLNSINEYLANFNLMSNYSEVCL